MRSKRSIGKSWQAEDDERPAGLTARARIRADLEQRGVAPDFSETLSDRLQDRVKSFDDPSYEPLLDGVAAACDVHCETAEEFAHRLRELGEIERLMSSFSGELGKLDEVLSVLAAHVARLRSNTQGRLLH